MKTTKCIITGQPVERCFKYKGCYYAFCCLGCMNTLINKICNKDSKVKSIKLKSCKGLKLIKLNAEQKKKLMMATKMPSTKKRIRRRSSSKKRSTKKKRTTSK